MAKKIIWVVAELITIAIGTSIFVTNILDSYGDAEDAGIGAFMVVSGLLLRTWRNDLFFKKQHLTRKSISKKQIHQVKTSC